MEKLMSQSEGHLDSKSRWKLLKTLHQGCGVGVSWGVSLSLSGVADGLEDLGAVFREKAEGCAQSVM